MKCEQEYCLYNKDCLCTVEDMAINSLGMCDTCILISLDEALLKTEKERQLLQLGR